MIVDAGGEILAARSRGRVVGCAALIPRREHTFELAKMTAARDARGHGIGLALLRATLARAAELEAASVFLVTRRELAAAVRLYERAGFHHVDDEQEVIGCPAALFLWPGDVLRGLALRVSGVGGDHGAR